MTVDLSTTNMLLGIMAVVSVLEALVVVGIGVAGLMTYRRVMTVLEGLENRQVAPAMARVNSILDDVKGVTTRVIEETNRVDHAIHKTIGRIDNTADRVRANVRVNTSRLVGIIRGTRVAIDTFLNHHEEAGNRQQATSNL
jgi:hypothetical protein